MNDGNGKMTYAFLIRTIIYLYGYDKLDKVSKIENASITKLGHINGKFNISEINNTDYIKQDYTNIKRIRQQIISGVQSIFVLVKVAHISYQQWHWNSENQSISVMIVVRLNKDVRISNIEKNQSETVEVISDWFGH